MIPLPIFGAFMEAAGTIIEKKLLKLKNLNYKNCTVYEFFSIVIISLAFVWFVWKLDVQAFEPLNLIIFASVVVLAIFANLLTFYSLKREDISEFEPIWLMQPLFTVLLAVIFF